jgi:hypothetical protein
MWSSKPAARWTRHCTRHVVGQHHGARNAIPVSLELDKYLALHNALEPLIASYARDAASAFTEVDRLAARYPADASASAVVQKIVARARSGLH